MHSRKYVTIKENGTYVDGKPTVFYHESAMVWTDLDSIKYIFDKVQQKIKNVTEIHIVASDTECPNNKHCITRDPSGAPGQNIWYRIKNANGKVSSWKFFAKYDGVLKYLAPVCGPMACLSYLAGGISIQEIEKNCKVMAKHRHKNMFNLIKSKFK